MATQLNKRIGILIAAARGRAGWSQADVAERVKMHLVSISNIERGEVQPTIETVLALADAFNVPVQDLLPVQSGMPKTTQKRWRAEAEIKMLLKDIPEKRLEAARAILEILARTE